MSRNGARGSRPIRVMTEYQAGLGSTSTRTLGALRDTVLIRVHPAGPDPRHPRSVFLPLPPGLPTSSGPGGLGGELLNSRKVCGRYRTYREIRFSVVRAG